MASDMVFALDSNPCSCDSKHAFQSNAIKDEFITQLSQCVELTRFAVDKEMTWLQRTVKDIVLKRQKAYDDTISPPSSNSIRSSLLGEVCLTLGFLNLDARLISPVPPCGGTTACGRCRSTVEGGQCAAMTTSGKPCFCSRQPYAVVQHRRSPPQSTSSCLPCTHSQREDLPHTLLMSAPQQQHDPMTVLEPTDMSGCDGGLDMEEEVLVDTCLRELFRVAPATSDYGALVEQLPQVWVGPRDALMTLADTMCRAMAVNFRIQGLDVPPWRRRAAVLARWQVQLHVQSDQPLLLPRPHPRPRELLPSQDVITVSAGSREGAAAETAAGGGARLSVDQSSERQVAWEAAGNTAPAGAALLDTDYPGSSTHIHNTVEAEARVPVTVATAAVDVFTHGPEDEAAGYDDDMKSDDVAGAAAVGTAEEDASCKSVPPAQSVGSTSVELGLEGAKEAAILPGCNCPLHPNPNPPLQHHRPPQHYLPLIKESYPQREEGWGAWVQRWERELQWVEGTTSSTTGEPAVVVRGFTLSSPAHAV